MEKNDNKRGVLDTLEKGERKRVRMESFGTWVSGCDVLPKELPYEEMAKQVASVEKAYKDCPETKEKDLKLFSQICPLPIAHAIARCWSFRPGVCYGSYEQRFLFFVLDFYIKKFAEKKRSLILVRLMEIAHYYGEEEEIYLSDYHSVLKVPEFAETILAVMSYSNLTLIHPETPLLKITTQHIKDEFGFDTIAQQSLFPGQPSITNPTLFLSLEMAKSRAIETFNELLTCRHMDGYIIEYIKPVELKLHHKQVTENVYLLSTKLIDKML